MTYSPISHNEFLNSIDSFNPRVSVSTISILTTMSESAQSPGTDKFKMGISIWLSLCVFACIWFLSRFVTGRRQLRSNLHVIEDGLRRMQEDLEQRQRENSIGYGENLEEIMEELKKSCLNKTSLCYKMRSQKVGVDVWKMIFGSCLYLGLAGAAWLLIKLICACFWLPGYLQSEEKTECDEKIDKISSGSESDEEVVEQDKKND